MEKFSQFADASTGANPFAPRWASAPRRPRCWRLLRAALLLPVAAVRIVLLAAVVLLAVAVRVVTAPLEAVGVAVPRRWCWALLCRAALQLLGVLHVEEQLGDNRRLRVHPGTAAAGCGSRQLCDRGRTVVVANFTSCVELLYLYGKLRPARFAVPTADGGHWALLELPAALRFALGFATLPACIGAVADLQEVGGTAPLVALPEGQKSNGTAQLQWTLPGAPSHWRRCVVAAFRYQDHSLLPHTEGSAACYGWRLVAGGLHHPVEVVWATATQVEAAGASDVQGLRELQRRLAPQLVPTEVHGRRLAAFAESFESKKTI